MLNLLELQAGDCVKLKTGATGEVTENIGDGIWVQVRFTSADSAHAVGDEELVHCEEISGLAVAQ
ncbi:hypothetical protein [Lacisediminimonas sp.]|uniref:hypothetical protein n=1 Tax=Lacisediminimonas sp. TaxID=3060582 RepID=UPI00271F0517|nr:hypothetical protein [Lacisediminimonas sp.]MDO8301459.1 hypothetical protein [Lacisediminimonas sp.]